MARVKAVRISGTLWQEFCTVGWCAGEGEVVRCIQGLPPGAKHIRTFYQEWNGFDLVPTLMLVFEHPDFEDVPEGARVPELNVVFTRDKPGYGISECEIF